MIHIFGIRTDLDQNRAYKETFSMFTTTFGH